MSSFKVYLAVGFALWYTLLRLRLAPVPLMRLWFFFVNVFTILPTSALTGVIVQLKYIGVPTLQVQRLCIVPLVFAFRAVWWLNPQIRMHERFDANIDGKPASWADVAERHAAFIGNHTSFWDVFAFICLTPLHVLLNTRTMMKATLRNIPIFGGIFDRVGNFPVFFKSDGDGSFEVDKEKQTVVQVGVDAHLGSGGSLAIFPEGAINKNPRVLQPFRYGTFATIFKHRMTVYYMVHVGGEKTWPRGSLLGGIPTDLRVRIGAFPVDFDKEDSKQVAARMRDFMQGVHTELWAEAHEAETAKSK